jgi:hypothetical protein
VSAEHYTSTTSQSPSRTLGICWIIYGIIRLAMALWLFFFSGTATVMFGALLSRAPDPFTLMSEFHFVYVGLIVLSALCGVLGLLGGMAMTGGQGSGRSVLILAAFLSLSEMPLGIALGVYTLIVLLPTRVAQASGQAQRAA